MTSDRRIVIREVDAGCWLAIAMDTDFVDALESGTFAMGADAVEAFANLVGRVEWLVGVTA